MDTEKKKKRFPGWILNPSPYEVEDAKHAQKAIIGLLILLAVILGASQGARDFKNQMKSEAEDMTATASEAVDSLVSGAGCSICVCEACLDCYMSAPIPPEEFVERALISARKHGASDADIAWMRDRWKMESWNNPVAIGQDGDIGLCQIHWASHKDVDPVKLMSNPEYAGEVCFRIVRDNRVCGEWQHCCYRRGICGCQLWLKEEKGVDVNWREDADCRRK